MSSAGLRAEMSAVTDETFEQEVLGYDKPVVVDFWADRCPPLPGDVAADADALPRRSAGARARRRAAGDRLLSELDAALRQ